MANYVFIDPILSKLFIIRIKPTFALTSRYHNVINQVQLRSQLLLYSKRPRGPQHCAASPTPNWPMIDRFPTTKLVRCPKRMTPPAEHCSGWSPLGQWYFASSLYSPAGSALRYTPGPKSFHLHCSRTFHSICAVNVRHDLLLQDITT